MSGAQALIEALKREKVEVIFGIPGGATIPIYDLLDGAAFRHILARHEQCAGHMADGYARISGKVGVCMATSGPGATNLVTAITNAYMDSSPVVAITGQVPRAMIGKDAFQEADIVGVMTPVTKYTYQPRRAADIPKAVKEAFYIASTGRPGPVLIDIPKDVQMEIAPMEFSSKVELRGYKPTYDPHPLQVKRAADILTQAERPMILSGGGVIISNATAELLALAELLSAPVATTLMGKGSFPEDHPLWIGGLGMHGAREANILVLEADALLAVGTRFSDRTTGRLDEFCPDAKIIHVDIDSAEIHKNAKVDIPIVADAKRTLEAIKAELIRRAEKRERSAWLRRVEELRRQVASETKNDNGAVNPRNIISRLRAALPEDAIVTTEVGQNQMWAYLHFRVLKPRTYITSGGLGTMGFGFPAALGAKVAKPTVPVVDIAGDGSFIMTEQDLATSVSEDIPVTVVVLNNHMLGMVAQWQRLGIGGARSKRYSAVKLGDVPDFVKLAEAYGARGVRIETLDQFSDAIREAVKSDVTTVIDVPIAPEENVFPLVPAGGALRDMMWE
ncbi:MAG: biosynthetic-type acetolactate synthase large subunit [Candidatus Bathyarchaeia archaeon]